MSRNLLNKTEFRALLNKFQDAITNYNKNPCESTVAKRRNIYNRMLDEYSFVVDKFFDVIHKEITKEELFEKTKKLLEKYNQSNPEDKIKYIFISLESNGYTIKENNE